MQHPKYFPYKLETHLVDHCNLNCGGCSHFAPLLKEATFADIESFKKDLKRFRQIFSDIYEIRLIGGEPLLHPDLVSFCGFTRDLYPKANISIFTNGKILLNMPDIFWRTCSEKKILLKLSYYPIDIDIAKIKEKASSQNVPIKIPKQIHQFMKTININGDSDPHQSFRHCQIMYKTPFLSNGKLYPCSLPPHIHFFNDFFKKKIPVMDNDAINIFDDISCSEIIDFISRPIPMCRWCISRRPFVPWARSKRDINEWVGDNEARIYNFIRMSKFRAIGLYQQGKKSLNIKGF